MKYPAFSRGDFYYPRISLCPRAARPRTARARAYTLFAALVTRTLPQSTSA